MRLRSRVGDRGDTLIEVLVAVVILGLAAVAILGGLAASAKTSSHDRGHSRATGYVRDFAESIEQTVSGGGYDPAGTYTYSPGGAYLASVVSAQCATTASEKTGAPAWGPCPGGGDVQLLTLNVTGPGGADSESLKVVVRRACNGTCS